MGGENERTIELVEEDAHLLGGYAEVSDILPEAHQAMSEVATNDTLPYSRASLKRRLYHHKPGEHVPFVLRDTCLVLSHEIHATGFAVQRCGTGPKKVLCESCVDLDT